MEPTRQTLGILPLWTLWAGPALYLLVTFLASVLISRAAVAIMFRPLASCPAEPWTERARYAFAARYAAGFLAMMLPAATAGLSGLVHGPLSPLPAPALAVLTAGAALVPALAAARALEVRLNCKAASFRSWLRGSLAFWLVLVPHLFVVLVAAVLMPRSWNVAAAGTLAVTVVLVWLTSRGGGLWVAMRLGLIRPATERLQGIVDRTAERVGFRPRVSWELAWDRPNAFAFLVPQAVIFTDGALLHLDDAELEAVCAHEIGHLREPPHVHRARRASAFLYLPLAIAQPVVSQWGILALGSMFWLMLLGLGAYARWSRRLEMDADAAGHADEQVEGALARSLERIHRVQLIPAVLGARGNSHPDLYDRMVAAGVPPAYPRPERPPKRRLVLTLLVAPAVLMAVLITLKLAPTLWHARDRENLLPARWAVSMGGGPRELSDLAQIYARKGELKRAIQLLTACCKLNDEDALYPAMLARCLARDQQCGQAEAALADADALAERYGTTDREDLWLERARRALEVCRDEETAPPETAGRSVVP